jgi:ERCC4-related helicase
MKSLFSYQKKVKEWALERKHPALFLEMRLGKTVITISTVLSYPIRERKKILVITPYSAMQGWRNELRDTRQFAIREITGTRAQRVKRLNRIRKERNTNYSIWCIVNPEIHRSIDIDKIGWDVVIFDESPYIKNPKSKMTKYYLRSFRLAKHRFILSGLPAPESELEYFTQCKFCEPDTFYERNYYEFRFANFSQFGYNWKIRPAGKRYVSRQLSKYCYFLTRENVKLGKRKIYETRDIALPKKLKKLYNKILIEWVYETREYEYEIAFQIEQYTELKRISGGIDKENNIISDYKMQAIEQLLKTELSVPRLIIYAHFVNEVNALYSQLSKHYHCEKVYGAVPPQRRTAAIESIRMTPGILIAQPSTMRYGADLSFIDTMIFYSTPESLEQRAQAEDRIVNVKRAGAPLVVDILGRGTVDEKIYKALRKKKNKYEMMRDIIQDLQNEIMYN